MLENVTVNLPPGFPQRSLPTNDVAFIPQKKNGKLKVIMDTLDQLNYKFEEFKSLLEKVQWKQLGNELSVLPSIPNLKGQIYDLLLQDGRSTAIQKIFSLVPKAWDKVPQETFYRFYEIPIELSPLESSFRLHDLSSEMSVVITEEQVYEFLSKFDTFEKFPSNIRMLLNKLTLFGSNSHFYQKPIEMSSVENSIHQTDPNAYELPIEVDIFDHAQISGLPETKHIETQTNLQHLKNLQSYSIDAISSERDISEMDDTVERLKGMIENMSRKGSSFSQLNGSLLDFDEEKPKIEKSNITGKCDDEKKDFGGQQNEKIKNKNHQLKEIYQIPVEMEIIREEPENKICYLDFRVFELAIGPGASQNTEQTFIQSLDMFNFQSHQEKFTQFTNLNKNLPGFKKNNQEKSMKKSNNKSLGPVRENIPGQSKIPIYILPDGTSSEQSKTEFQLYSSRIRNSIQLNERPSLKESTIEVAQFYDIQQRFHCLEEQKIELVEKVRKYQEEIKILKYDLDNHKESLNYLERKNSQEEDKLLEKLQTTHTSLVKLQSQKEENSQKMFEMNELNNYLEEKLGTVLGELTDRENQIEELRSRFQDFEKQFVNLYEKMTNENSQRDILVIQMEREEALLKKAHRNEINQLLKTNEELKTVIEQLTREVQLRKTQNDDLKIERDEAQNKLISANEELDEFKEVFFAEYKRVKEHNEGQIIIKDYMIDELRQENERFKKTLLKEKEKVEKINKVLLKEKENSQIITQDLFQVQEHNSVMKKTMNEYLSVMQELRLEVDDYDQEIKMLKRELKTSSQIQQEIEQNAQQQLLKYSQMLDNREKRIKQLDIQLRKMKESQNSIKINSHEDQFNISYISELKGTILNYEKIIVSYHSVIRELQDRVYDFMKDAIEKEEEADAFHDAFKNYETEMYELLAEKMSLDLENKKLKRNMKQSEKTPTFGNHFTKVNTPIAPIGKIIEDSLETGPKIRKAKRKSRNGTIKLQKEA